MAKGKGRGLGSRGIAGFGEISGGFGKNRDGDGAGGDPGCSQRPRGTEAIPKFPFLLLDSRWEKGNVREFREFRDFREIREIGEMREFGEFVPSPTAGTFLHPAHPEGPVPGPSPGKFGREIWRNEEFLGEAPRPRWRSGRDTFLRAAFKARDLQSAISRALISPARNLN